MGVGMSRFALQPEDSVHINPAPAPERSALFGPAAKGVFSIFTVPVSRKATACQVPGAANARWGRNSADASAPIPPPSTPTADARTLFGPPRKNCSDESRFLSAHWPFAAKYRLFSSLSDCRRASDRVNFA